MKNKIPEEYSDLITFREDVGENGRYIINHIPVHMLFDYMAEGFSLEWISENFSLTIEELEMVQDFIYSKIPPKPFTDAGVPYMLIGQYMVDGYSPQWISSNFPVTREELQKVHEFIGEIL